MSAEQLAHSIMLLFSPSTPKVYDAVLALIHEYTAPQIAEYERLVVELHRAEQQAQAGRRLLDLIDEYGWLDDMEVGHQFGDYGWMPADYEYAQSVVEQARRVLSGTAPAAQGEDTLRTDGAEQGE